MAVFFIKGDMMDELTLLIKLDQLDDEFNFYDYEHFLFLDFIECKE